MGLLCLFFFLPLLFLSSSLAPQWGFQSEPVRMALLAFFFLLNGVVLFFTKPSLKLKKFRVPAFLLLLFLSINVASVYWTINVGWTLQYSLQLCLCVIAFFYAQIIVQKWKREAYYAAAIVVFFLVSIFVSDAIGEAYNGFTQLEGGYFLMLNGIPGHRNLLSIYCFFLLVASWGIASELKAWKYRLFFYALPLLLFFTILFSHSRLVTVVTVICILLMIRAKGNLTRKVILRSIMVGVPLLFLLIIQTWDSFGNRYDPAVWMNSRSFTQRVFWWSSSVEQIQTVPILGAGAGTWSLAIDGVEVADENQEFLEKRFRNPHNDYLKIAGETGIPSLLLFLLFIASMLFYCLPSFAKGNDNSRLYAFMLAFGLAMFSILYAPRGYFDESFIAFLLMGLFFPQEINSKKSVGKLYQEKSLGICLLILASAALYFSIQWVNAENINTDLAQLSSDKKWDEIVEVQESGLNYMSTLTKHEQPQVFYFAFAHWNLKNYEQAKEACLQGIKENPYSAACYFYLANILRKEKHFEEALLNYQKAIALEPFREFYRLRMSEALIDLGKLEEAIPIIECATGFEKMRERLHRRIDKVSRKRKKKRK